jgi:hypothetical protein
MGMVAYYLQTSPEQGEAIEVWQLQVDHSTFFSGGSFLGVAPALVSPTLVLILVGVIGLAVCFWWFRGSLRPAWRWCFGLALLGMAITLAVFAWRSRPPPLSVSTAQVAEPLNIDKSWHGIHFLLTGSAWGGKPPLFNAVLGGREFGPDLGYGPARYLTPDQVKEVAVALEAITKETLRARFDPRAMTEANIYSWHEDKGEEGLEYFLEYYLEVRAYFSAGASQNHGMILCIM